MEGKELEGKDIVICENCGAEIDIHDAKCPFCGHINQYGAEEKYMQEMEHIKSELEQVDEEQAELIKKEAMSGWRIFMITVLSVVAIIAVVAVIFTIYSKKMEAHFDELGLYESDPLKAAKWNDTHLADMEAMYDAGDIEGLVAYYVQLKENGDLGAFNSWTHSFLITEIESMRFWSKYIDEGQDTDSMAIHQIMFNMLYYYNGDYKGTLMPEEDYDIILEEVDRHMEKVKKRFGITDEFMAQMNEACVGEYGYIDPARVDKYCDSNKDIFK